MFPTCSEILEVLVGLGYRQVAEKSDGFSFDDENKAETEESEEFAEELEV